MKMNQCDYCILFIHHIDILLSENIKDCCKSNLLELKNYYRLSNIFDIINENCNECINKKRYSRSIELLKDVLLKNGVELNNSNKKCDICRVLPNEIFILLDMTCNIYSTLEKLDSLYEELQYQESLLYLSELAFGKCNNCDNFIDYYHNIKLLSKFLENKNIDLLKQEVYEWKLISANDYIINAANKVFTNGFKTIHKIGFIDKSTIYLDFNIFDKYEKNSDFKFLLDSAKEKGIYKFVCSPTHMEEICRMNNNEYEAERLKSIYKLTDGVEIISYNGILTFCTEDLNECLVRAKKYSEMNNEAEGKNCIHVDEQSLFYNKYSSETFSKMINQSSLLEMINNSSEDNIDKKRKEELPNESEINKIMHKVCFHSYKIKDFQNIYSENITYTNLHNAINSIFHIFNVLGYNSDKLTKKNDMSVRYPVFDKKYYRTIRSSIYDVNHVCYATKCNYFISNDKKLCKRAKEIYNFIGCKTKVITYDELTQML